MGGRHHDGLKSLVGDVKAGIHPGADKTWQRGKAGSRLQRKEEEVA